jgi:hypothetical protein
MSRYRRHMMTSTSYNRLPLRSKPPLPPPFPMDWMCIPDSVCSSGGGAILLVVLVLKAAARPPSTLPSMVGCCVPTPLSTTPTPAAFVRRHAVVAVPCRACFETRRPPAFNAPIDGWLLCAHSVVHRPHPRCLRLCPVRTTTTADPPPEVREDRPIDAPDVNARSPSRPPRVNRRRHWRHQMPPLPRNSGPAGRRLVLPIHPLSTNLSQWVWLPHHCSRERAWSRLRSRWRRRRGWGLLTAATASTSCKKSFSKIVLTATNLNERAGVRTRELAPAQPLREAGLMGGGPVGGILCSGGRGRRLTDNGWRNMITCRSFSTCAHSSTVYTYQNKLLLRQSLYLGLPVGLTKHLCVGTIIACRRMCKGGWT